MNEAGTLLRVVLSLGIVTALIWAIGWAMKKTGMHRRWQSGKSIDTRIEVKSSLMLDPRRRLVVVRCDNREHVLLLGQNKDLLIESKDAVKTDSDR